MSETSEGRPRARVAFATLGCKVNQAETDHLTHALAEHGCEVVDFENDIADAYIINTCTVTHVADRKSRHLIRQAARRNPEALVAVTGCYAAVAPKEVAALPGVDLVIGLTDKERAAQLVIDKLRQRDLLLDELPEQNADGTLSAPYRPLPFLPAIGSSESRTRAFIKVQDGCDAHCTYCIVPMARGSQRSTPAIAVLMEARAREAAGVKEIVLAGVHIGTYGSDLNPTENLGPDGRPIHNLHDLVKLLLDFTTIPRIRLSSAEPEYFGNNIYDLWADGRVCPHLHLPVQSGSDLMLKRMGRKYRTADYERIVEKAREAIPHLALTTDVIVGFPGEGEQEWADSLAFIEKMRFAEMHIFRYSPRKGTAATRLRGQVHPDVQHERSRQLIELGKRHATEYRRSFIGQTEQVLFETASETPTNGEYLTGDSEVAAPEALSGEGMIWSGLTGNYIRVWTRHPGNLANRLLPVRLVAEHDNGLIGVVGR